MQTDLTEFFHTPSNHMELRLLSPHINIHSGNMSLCSITLDIAIDTADECGRSKVTDGPCEMKCTVEKVSGWRGKRRGEMWMRD